MLLRVRKVTAGRAALLTVALLLAACGGGGETSEDGRFASISLSARASSAGIIELSWSPPSGGVSFSPYNIARTSSGSSQVIGSTTALNYTVGGLGPGIEYCFVIKNPLTGNTASNTACATTPRDTSAPTTPGGLVATALSSAEVQLTWNHSSDDIFVAGYNIYRDDALLMSTSGVGGVDARAVPEATHCYRISAYDEAGNESARSAEACVTMSADSGIPTAPGNLVAEFRSASNRSFIALSWSASVDDGVVRHYRIYRDGTYLSDSQDTSYEDEQLEAATSYCYTVTAVDAAGNESQPAASSCAREGAPAQGLGAFNALHASIALDSSDNPVIAFKQYGYDSAAREIRIPLKLLRLGSTPNPEPEVLEEGLETFWFNDAYRHGLALDSNDAVHLVHKINHPTGGEEIRHLQVNSGLPIRSTITRGNDALSSIGLASDSSGAVHACYTQNGQLYYASNRGGAWTSTEMNSLLSLEYANDCDIAIGPDDRLHVSLLDSLDLKYAGKHGDGWSLATLDRNSGNSVASTFNTAITTDSAGNAHIAYFHDFADNDLEYATNASGSWITSKIDSSGRVGYDCDIAADSAGKVHISYEDHSADALLKYASNKSGVWVLNVLGGAGAGNTSLAIDSMDRVHIAYTSGENELMYARIDD